MGDFFPTTYLASLASLCTHGRVSGDAIETQRRRGSARDAVDLLEVVAQEERQAADDRLPREVGRRRLVLSFDVVGEWGGLRKKLKSAKHSVDMRRSTKRTLTGDPLAARLLGLTFALATAISPPPPVRPCSSAWRTCRPETARAELRYEITTSGSSVRL